ncbi:hypothetical protein BpHYR1_018988, partial [Brachionus plicatilis]
NHALLKLPIVHIICDQYRPTRLCEQTWSPNKFEGIRRPEKIQKKISDQNLKFEFLKNIKHFLFYYKLTGFGYMKPSLETYSERSRQRDGIGKDYQVLEQLSPEPKIQRTKAISLIDRLKLFATQVLLMP